MGMICLGPTLKGPVAQMCYKDDWLIVQLEALQSSF